MRKNIDHGRLIKRLWFVGASGFFATGYAFFASNVTKPGLYYVYPPCGRLDSNAGMVMDELTLIGAAVGMLAAGNLADLWGRKKLYGFELALLIVATLGMVQASEGFRSRRADGTSEHTMDIYSWLTWWRFCQGLAIGAEHPLVAIITAEWVRTKSRGRMLAAVFAMQPVARLVAYGVGLAVLKGASSANGLSPDTVDDGDLSKRIADQVWRWVTGIAIIPAAMAVGFRFTIPETPLYYADIRRDTVKGLKKMARLYPDTSNNSSPPITNNDVDYTALGADSDSDSDNFSVRDWYAGALHILRTTPAGRNLLLLCALWFLSDISWYCLSLESPSAMVTLWPNRSTISVSSSADSDRLTDGASCPEFDSWRADAANPSTSMYRELERSATRFMLVVSIGSILGSLALITVINRVHRRVLLMVSCTALAVLFAVTGAVLLGTRSTPESGAAVDVLFGAMHFLFTLGPRTLVLIMAVELFPTVYRGTFYGMAAAVGKVGAIAIRPIIGRTGKQDMALGIRLMVVVVLMALCVFISYKLPEVQRVKQTADTEASNGEGEKTSARRATGWVASLLPKLATMTLEEIAPNPHEQQTA
jgi:PHS family inorganic phosphate transporter-like MFS transporter